jgi:sugar O-acyltransferase (sialic acid O-acetyltransferase NeuD family)
MWEDRGVFSVSFLFGAASKGFDVRRLFVFGAGGAGREVAWLAQQVFGPEVELVFLVSDPAYLGGAVDGIDVVLVGDVEARPRDGFVCAVGDADLRRRAALECLAAGLKPVSLVHPRVEASTRVSIGEGAIICAGSVLTVGVEIGDYAYINVGCTLSHDVTVGKFSTLSPGVHVSGHVEIGEGAFVGTGASIINGRPTRPLVIGRGALVAAGACVTGPVEPGAMVAGVPAVRKRRLAR